MAEQKTGEAVGSKAPEGGAAGGTGAAGAAGGAGEAGKTGEQQGGQQQPPAAGDGEKKTPDGEQGKGGQQAGAEASKVPDKYVLTLPDGTGEWLDAADLAQVEVIAKERKWTNEQAQEEVNRYADHLVAQSAAFRAQVEADKDYGGDKLSETQRLAQQVIDTVRPKGTVRGDGFRKLLVKSGYGNNLEVISFLADLGKLMAEDAPARGSSGSGASGEKDAASVLYDHPKSKALASA